MISHVCMSHSTPNANCPMCSGRWKSRYEQFMDAIRLHHPTDQVVIGDPTNLMNQHVDRGWDMESKKVDDLMKSLVEYQIEATMSEYDQDWKNKEVKNKDTGNTVKVGSLSPDQQAQYRPDKEKSADPKDKDPEHFHPSAASQPAKDEYKKVPGGIVVNKPMTPQQFKEKTDKMTPASSMVSKKWNSKFDVFRDDKGVYHLFHSAFDRGEVDGGAMNPERANTVKHIGAFTDAESAKKYVMGGDLKWDLDQDKRYTLAKQTQWTNKEMGV